MARASFCLIFFAIIYNELLVRGFDVDTGVVEMVEVKKGHRAKK